MTLEQAREILALDPDRPEHRDQIENHPAAQSAPWDSPEQIRAHAKAVVRIAEIEIEVSIESSPIGAGAPFAPIEEIPQLKTATCPVCLAMFWERRDPPLLGICNRCAGRV